MLARPHPPFLMFALFSVGCGTGIASLISTIPRFGMFGGVVASAAIGILMAIAGAIAIPWLASCFERSARPPRPYDILDEIDDPLDR